MVGDDDEKGHPHLTCCFFFRLVIKASLRNVTDCKCRLLETCIRSNFDALMLN